VLVFTVTTWDALISSTLYAVGFGQVDTANATGTFGGAARGVATVSGVASQAFPLFQSGGGTEATGPVLGLLTAASVTAAAVLYTRGRTGRGRYIPFLPVILMLGYALLIGIGDALVTGSAPHYGTQKMGFTAAVLALAATLPAAFLLLDPRRTGVTLARGLAALGVLFLLVVDTLLPRGLSAVSMERWPAVDPEKPPYWAAAEVKPVPEQSIDSLPMACVFLPNGAEVPSGQPDGQLAYSCSRLLIGLSGLEGKVGGFMDWIGTDWLSNGQYWNDWWGAIDGAKDEVRGKRILLLDADGRVIGFETFQGLLDRFPPPPPDSP
jgi:hypothetical protein